MGGGPWDSPETSNPVSESFPSAVLGGDSVGPFTPLKGRRQIPGGEQGCGATGPGSSGNRGQDSAQAPDALRYAQCKSSRQWSPGSEASGFTLSPHFPVSSINLGEQRCQGPRPDAGRLCLPPTPGGASHPLSQIPPPRGRNVPRGLLKFDFELSWWQTSWSTIRELVGNPGESQSRSTGPCVLGRTCVHPQSLRLSTSFQKGT